MACTKIAFSAIVLFTFNCLYLFAGIVFTVGWIIPLVTDPDHVQGDRRGFFQHTAFHDWFTLRVMLTSGGLLLFCTAILGCIASVKKKVWMLMSFAFLLAVCVGLQIAGGLKNSTNRVASDMWSETGFTDVVKKYWIDPQNHLAIVADHFQHSLECCGFHGFQDWNISMPEHTTVPDSAILGMMPRSCCVEREPCIAAKDVYQNGCKSKIDIVLANWKSNVHATHAIVVAIILLEVIGLFLALQIVNWINEIKEGEKRYLSIYGPTKL